MAGALLVGGLLFGGEQQPTPKVKVKLPQYWNKLGLSDEQKKKISAIHAEYRDKIEPLRKEISKLEEQEKQELGRVLTDAQRGELKKILAAKALSEPPAEERKPKEDKKSKDEKKSGDQ